MKPAIVTVVGARPQFIKLAPLARALEGQARHDVLHTGQHYDRSMSDGFFDDLGLPAPTWNLGIGSGSHGEQTGAMLAQIEQVLTDVRPDCVITLGDTNSTLAAALVASKLGIGTAHVEAGLRSNNRRMPEELNRIVADHVSDWLFAPSLHAVETLAGEGIVDDVWNVGDIMLDGLNMVRSTLADHRGVFGAHNLEPGHFILATLHRAENVDNPAWLANAVSSLGALGQRVIWPIHPRTRAQLLRGRIELPDSVTDIGPVGYLDSLQLIDLASCVVTDSGGMQKEAFYLHTPCVTVRTETEWPETVEAGWNILFCFDWQDLPLWVSEVQSKAKTDGEPYGDGHSARRIVSVLMDALIDL